MTGHPSILVLYGLDENSSALEITSTLSTVQAVTQTLLEEGWRALPLQATYDLATSLRPFDPNEWIVLNLCEGEPQQAFYYARATRVLSELGFTFTGSDAWALDETQYKWRMKALLEAARVPTPLWAVFERADDVVFDRFPAIVKPGATHCSYGITRDSVVFTLAEARAQAERVIATFRQPVIVESFLDSIEYNVTIWGDREPVVLGVSAMTYDAFSDVRDRLCSFEAKWIPQSEAYQRIPAICPAPMRPWLRERVEAIALAAYRATECRDYGRVDLRLDGDQPMVLDVNANCDISPEGGFANAARAAGLTYGQMLNTIIQFAIARQRLPIQNAVQNAVEVVQP